MLLNTTTQHYLAVASRQHLSIECKELYLLQSLPFHLSHFAAFLQNEQHNAHEDLPLSSHSHLPNSDACLCRHFQTKSTDWHYLA